MKKAFHMNLLRAMGIAAAAAGAAGCVDHGYDLAEDIDMTVGLGGESLTVPGSSTDVLYLSKILNLKNDSSIKAVEKDGDYGLTAGDYVLIQEGNSTPSHFDVPEVTVGHIDGSTTTTELPEFYSTGTEAAISNPTGTILNTMRLSDDDVNRDLVALESADMDVRLEIDVRLNSDDFRGTAYVEKGYTIAFDKCWTVEVADEATGRFLESADHRTVRFKERCGVAPGRSLKARLRLVRADLTALPAGQGLYAPGKFLIENDVVSGGDISIDSRDMAAGAKAHLTVVSEITVSEARLLKVRGIVDPKIDISETRFEISDIPEFLNDPANNLDMSDPRITVSITNNSPLSITLNGRLSSYSDGNRTASVGIGESYGTAPVTARGNATTDIVISRRPVAGAANNIVVSDLSSLLTTIPDYISFGDAEAKAVREVSEYTLGCTYTYNCDYTAIIPLAFGDRMQLYYTHTEDDWNEDLEKYNFNTAVVTADVVNTIPLDMVPSAKALDANGNEYQSISVSVEGNVTAGSMYSPSTSKLKITLKSSGENIGGLNGVELLFHASANKGFAGTNLNKNQAMKFDNIKITLVGGVLIDLNK